MKELERQLPCKGDQGVAAGRKAPLPFTTSTLQQEAAKTLNFSTQKTMQVAQQLYEGVDVKGHGTIGLITYLRTDSTRICEEAEAAARIILRKDFGAGLCGGSERRKKTGKEDPGCPRGHPSDRSLIDTGLHEGSLTRDQFRFIS